MVTSYVPINIGVAMSKKGKTDNVRASHERARIEHHNSKWHEDETYFECDQLEEPVYLFTMKSAQTREAQSITDLYTDASSLHGWLMMAACINKRYSKHKYFINNAVNMILRADEEYYNMEDSG